MKEQKLKIFLVYRLRDSYIGWSEYKCFTCIAFNSVIIKRPEKLGGRIDCGGGQSAAFASFPHCVDIKKPRGKRWLDQACSLNACGRPTLGVVVRCDGSPSSGDEGG